MGTQFGLFRALDSDAERSFDSDSERVIRLGYQMDGSRLAPTKVLLTGGWDNTVQFWDMRVGHSVKSIFGPHLSGDSLDVCGDEILTGSWWVPVSDKVTIVSRISTAVKEGIAYVR